MGILPRGADLLHFFQQPPHGIGQQHVLSGRCSSPRSKSTWSQVRFTSSLPCTPICQLIHRAMPAAELSSF